MPSRLQLALNVNDIDAGRRLLLEAVRHRARQAPARLRQLRDRRAAAQARPAGKPRRGRQPQPPRRRGPRHRHRRGRAGAPRPGRARPGCGGRDHLLLRQAGQVLGPGRTRRRVLGDLHRPGRQPDLLRRGPRPGVLRRDQRPHRRNGRVSSQVLLVGAPGCRTAESLQKERHHDIGDRCRCHRRGPVRPGRRPRPAGARHQPGGAGGGAGAGRIVAALLRQPDPVLPGPLQRHARAGLPRRA